MYRQSAQPHDRIYVSKDYKAESGQVAEIIRGVSPEARTLLDVGCGSGGHLEHLSEMYEVEGLDISAEMVAAARRRLPAVTIYKGNMINFKLRRKYDVVLCLFSSIGYVQSVRNLNKAIKCMARHLSAIGVLLVEPWFTDKTWKPNDVYASFVDDPELKAARISTNRREGRLSIIEMHYLIGSVEGVRYYRETHRLGLFTEDEMTKALRDSGLQCRYLEKGITGRGLYVGTKK